MNEGSDRFRSTAARRIRSPYTKKYFHHEEPKKSRPGPPCPGLKPGGKREKILTVKVGSTGGKDPPVSGGPCDHREAIR